MINVSKKKEIDTHLKVSLFKVLKYGISIIWKTIPVLFIANNLITIMCGILFGLVTFVTQGVFDSVAKLLLDKTSIRQAYSAIFGLCFVFIAKEVLNGINLFCDKIINEKTNGTMLQIIHSKMSRIEPTYLEDSKMFDDIEKASVGAKTILYIVNMGIGFFTFNLPYFIFMWIYLHNIKPQFVLAIVLIFIPILLSQFVRTGIMSRFEDETTPIRREKDFYVSAIVDREYYKETRMLGAYFFFVDKLICALKKLEKAEWKMNKRTNILELVLSIISVTGYISILFMLISALLSGEITVGAFAAVFSSIDMLYTVINEMINYQIGEMAKNMGMAHNFIRFIELPERQGSESNPNFKKGIIVNNISFTYPNAEHRSIDGVNLNIKAGETVAIVGENGAGKTTLIRLMIGLYKPNEGKVILNGMDTSEVCCDSLFLGISGVFQNFQRYQMTLEENIRISDVNSEEKIDKVIEQANVDVVEMMLSEGKNTMLSREFGGIDLSGGQWQRVAIARGLYRFHEVIILDEPTASIDPIEESHIYRKFIEISKDKTAIIITHRLGSVKIADRVIVMEQGKIVGVGTHYDLLNQCTKYADMYNEQAEWYNSE